MSPSSAEGGMGWVEGRSALAGGLVVAVVLFLVTWSVGEVGGARARILLEASLPSVRFLASSILTVGATIMALMLTLLGVSDSTEHTFKRVHYRRIRLMSLMNAIAIAGAILILLAIGVPLEESEKLRAFYDVVYYALLSAASLLGGLMVAIVLILHRTIKGLSTAASPADRSGPLVRDDE